MSLPKNYKLFKEHPLSYEIHDEKDGKTFHIAKHGLTLDMHGKLSKIKKYSDGGKIADYHENNFLDDEHDDSNKDDAGENRIVESPLDLGRPNQAFDFNGYNKGGDVEPNSSREETEDEFIDSLSSPKKEEAKPKEEDKPEAAPVKEKTPERHEKTSSESWGHLIGRKTREASPLHYFAPMMKPVVSEIGDFVEGATGQPTTVPESIPSNVDPELVDAATTTSSQSGSPFTQQGELDSLNSQKQALADLRRAESIAGIARQDAYEDFFKMPPNIPTPEERFLNRQKQTQELLNKYKTYEIDPNRVLNEEGTGGKILTAISILLSGMGAGAHGKNLALEVLNNQIERDINAQKSNNQRSFDLLKLNLDLADNEEQAYLNLRQQKWLAVQAKLAQADSSLMSPMAKFQATQLSTDIEQKISKINLTNSYIDAARSGQIIKADPIQAINASDKPQELKDKAIQEVEDAKQLKQIKEGLMNAQEKIEKMHVNGLFSPAQKRALVGPYIPILTRIAEHRYTEAAAKSYVDAFINEYVQGDEATAVKHQNLDKTFNLLASDGKFTSVVPIPLQQFAPARMPQWSERFKKTQGLNVTREEAIQLIKANQHSKDPSDQKTIQLLKQKFKLGP